MERVATVELEVLLNVPRFQHKLLELVETGELCRDLLFERVLDLFKVEGTLARVLAKICSGFSLFPCFDIAAAVLDSREVDWLLKKT